MAEIFHYLLAEFNDLFCCCSLPHLGSALPTRMLAAKRNSFSIHPSESENLVACKKSEEQMSFAWSSRLRKTLFIEVNRPGSGFICVNQTK
jgi:hypothetical protein